MNQVADSVVQTNAKAKPGAYLSKDGQLWLQLGFERDADGQMTGAYELENARGEWSAYGNDRGCYVYRRIAITHADLLGYELAREAATVDELDAEMAEHLRGEGLDLPSGPAQAGLPEPKNFGLARQPPESTPESD